MLRNSLKIMNSSTNQWPQTQLPLDDQKSFMASSSSSSVTSNKAMEKPNQGDPPPPQLPLKCPRCDSSNTKFCYYNNYSLSQPRHFCKACKRYWTRGGTLRNVPVGGGCRKNKRVKRQIVSSSGGGDGLSSTSAAAAAASPSLQSRIDLSPASNHINNPLFYSLGANPIELNFPFSTFGSARVSNDHASAFDLHHQMNGLGVGYSPGVINGDRKNGFRQFQDVVGSATSTNPPFYSSAGTNNPIFGSSNFAASTSTMASLLSSGFQQHKYGTTDLKEIHDDSHLISHNGDTQIPGRNGEIGKEVKMGEVDHNRLSSWMNNPNPTTQISSSSDPAAMGWSPANVGAWFDPSDIGSSVSSLI